MTIQYEQPLITTVLSLVETSFRVMTLQQEGLMMSKGQDSKKDTKKKPLLTQKEKKAAKASKKTGTSVLGN